MIVLIVGIFGAASIWSEDDTQWISVVCACIMHNICSSIYCVAHRVSVFTDGQIVLGLDFQLKFLRSRDLMHRCYQSIVSAWSQGLSIQCIMIQHHWLSLLTNGKSSLPTLMFALIHKSVFEYWCWAWFLEWHLHWEINMHLGVVSPFITIVIICRQLSVHYFYSWHSCHLLVQLSASWYLPSTAGANDVLDMSIQWD